MVRIPEQKRYLESSSTLSELTIHRESPQPCPEVLGFAAGQISIVKVNCLLLQVVSVIGAGWAEYVRAGQSYPAKRWAALEPLLRAGKLTVAERTVCSMDRAAQALRVLESWAASGKIVLTFA